MTAIGFRHITATRVGGPGHVPALSVAAAPAFVEGAACASVDPDLFFTDATGHMGARQERDAKGVCRRCPVLAECREWAIEAPLGSHGIIGGLNPRELRMLRRNRLRESA